ncbi:trimethylamine-N-oxide reductase (cytochrome c) 2, cytochrome c-type subunit TorY [Thermosulfidibacter takaii ABI70S6]|uniref:Cytochrome c-type protein n=1 Tax=Thermosulfidibacter takaii (strain DSM 17441 / JCM 13301 / NBRC 103674 / ABI70S6) TaxID=1298851 RepID=A0A0S3QUM3_THET7|nr:NapC/NirT family cytochrome c [Thermosulfidibacter takaii]BAT72015.1 trimethylamine-N-oxide reductase (cytochrome c) 2, cytochrome c-type subunit TorY [Thermosulfidibacter takaii ABI70S6]
MKKTFVGFVVGFILAGIVALVSASKIIETNRVSFCASCHEMKVFHETWANAAHGLNHRGVIRAKCSDCHLPHEGLLKYLVTKTKAGLSDYYAHMTNKKASLKEWLEELKNVKRPRVAYESGCRECHKELIGNGIPIKAILAHRAYLLKETDRTCVSCHNMVGHGDIVAVIKDKIKQEGGEL